MKDLIRALQIFFKYDNDRYPLKCRDDVLFVNCNPEDVSKEDISELSKIGFYTHKNECFISRRFGSC